MYCLLVKYFISIFYTVLLLMGNFLPVRSQTPVVNINHLIPSSEEIPGWLQDGESEYAKGADLYTVIDGGAEIYNEYGFQQAVFQTYMTKNKNQINLAIYEMNDSPSAYGIYSFSTDTGGVAVDVGEEGWLSSYYLNFWKGNFLVTIIGLDDSKETMNGIIQFAKAVDQKIQTTSEYPDLIKYLPAENLLPNGITYIKGLLALFKTYNFHPTNIFNFIAGLYSIYDSHEIFLFTYYNGSDARQWFNSAIKNLEEIDKYSDFSNRKDYTVFRDEIGNDFATKVFQNFIIILKTHKELDQEHIFIQVEKLIKAMSNSN